MKSMQVMELESKVRQLISIIEILKKDLPDLSDLIDRWIKEITEDKKDASS